MISLYNKRLINVLKTTLNNGYYNCIRIFNLNGQKLPNKKIKISITTFNIISFSNNLQTHY